MNLIGLDPDTRKNVEEWLNSKIDSETKEAIKQMAKEDPQALIDAFYTHLSFGTGGLRGLMGIGTNRINRYSIRIATQGLCNYIKNQGIASPSACIGYDSRHQSREFAVETARVFAGNGIQAYLLDGVHPTPLVSYGARFKGCIAAVMITASHNPPSYNGYKVYWGDGSQVVPPHDQRIIEEVRAVKNPDQVQVAPQDDPLILQVKEEIDISYLDTIEKLQTTPEFNRTQGKNLRIVYSNLHGTGGALMKQALQRWHFTDVQEVREQAAPDGDFPTVESPNPEDPEAMEMGTELLLKVEGDILIATDPDADRLGVVVRHHGKPYAFNGNQIACILLYHLLSNGAQRPDSAVIKTIATTELFHAIADSYKVPCFDTLPGFKYIAALIREWEEKGEKRHFLFGGEESYGYLLGDQTRDKDGIIAALLACEAASQAKERNQTLVDTLFNIYRKYGVYWEKLSTIRFQESKEGRQQMAQAMTGLQQNPPTSIEGRAIETVDNYITLTRTHLKTGETQEIKSLKSQALLFWLEDGTKMLMRPSGTEPKIKVYCGMKGAPTEEVEAALQTLQKESENLIRSFRALLKI